MASIERRIRQGRHVWRVRYRTPEGIQRNKTFARRAEADRFLASVEGAKFDGTFVDPAKSKETVGLWAHHWLDGLVHLKPSTLSRYKGIVRKQIKPEWASVELGSITPAQVQQWVVRLAANLSPASVRKVVQVFSLILDLAVKDGRLARNHARGVNLPRVVKQEHCYLTHRQVAILATECGFPSDVSKHVSLAERENDTSRLLVLFLAYTGVRWGEMAALRVSRLDLVKRRALIAESVTPVQGLGLVWGTPKSHQRRSVPIPRFLADELASLIEGRSPTDLVFPSVRSGEPIRVTAFKRTFRRAAEHIGVPGLHPHDLRHTAASLSIAAGADVKVVQQMLGHASATMTLDLYGHLFDDRLDEVADALDAARAAANR